MPTVDETVAVGADGFRLGMLTAADIVDRLVNTPMPELPQLSSDQRMLIDETRKATLASVAKLIRDAAPAA